MKEEKLEIKYRIFTLEELNAEDKELIDHAIEMTDYSYSPYSHFKVGCAVRLSTGEIVGGTNQENISYPNGLCAERTALFAAGTKEGIVSALAISAKDKNNKLATAFPCGSCRQVMIETETQRSKKPIKVLIHRQDNTIIQFDSVSSLIPFSFDF
jgi:cytidine deaminase